MRGVPGGSVSFTTAAPIGEATMIMVAPPPEEKPRK
jgi:hypothetical protein